MLKLKNKIFLFLTIMLALVGLASCTGAGSASINIRFDQEKVYVRLGGTIELAPTITKGEDVGLVELVWSSSDDAIASVEDGKVTGNKLGEVTVKAILKGNIINYDKIQVEVVETLLPKLSVTNAKAEMYKGEEFKLDYTIGKVVGATLESKVAWSSLNEKVASVDEEGNVKALSAGTTILLAKVYNGDEERIEKYPLTVLETDFSIIYDLAGGVNGENPESYNIFELPVALQPATRENYNFLGWYLGDELVTELPEGLTGDIELVAKWQLNEFQIEFDLNGGQFSEFTYDSFANYMVDLFNNSTDPGKKVVTIETFHTNSHPNIKGVFDKAEVLAELQWFFIFAKNEITANCEANGVSEHLAETVELLDRLIAGDTTAISGSYANGRSVFRHFMHNLFNKDHESAGSTGGAYLKYTTDFSLEENQARFIKALDKLPESYMFGDELPVPTRLGYDFLGWYDGEVLVETAQRAATLVAKWEETKYNVSFDLDGGQFGKFTYDSFANYMVDLFNNSTDPGKKVVTVETFHTNSHPNIKGVFDKAEVLAELQWFFIFAKEEITANCEANGVSEHLAETVELLDRLIAGDTTAISGSYANGRSVFRHFMHNLFNKNHESAGSTGGAYLKYTTDFSLEENQARFMNALLQLPAYYTYGQELPVPTKEGYKFLGWYAGEAKVEKVTSDLEVVAKWEVLEYSISYELNGGLVEPSVDMSGAEVLQSFKLTDYLTYAAATGYKAALITNVPAKFWNYIVLQESGIEGVYKIAQIVSGSANVTESYVYTIAWHSALTDAEAKAVLDGMLAKAADYVGQYVIFENLPAEKQADCEITAKVVKPESIKVVELVEKYAPGQEVVLLPATKEGYEFLGWELNGSFVDKIAAGTEGDLELVAKWEAIEYSITLDVDGGELPKEVDLSTAEVLQTFKLTDYLTYAAATGYKAALITNVPAKFWSYIVLQESGIEGVYKIAQIVSGSANVTESYVYTIAWHSALTDADAKAVLDGMLAKAADYVGQYVLFENLPAEKQADCEITAKVVKPESIGYKEPNYSFTVEDELELPAPTKEGFNFLGWYAGEVLVEKVVKGTIGNLELVAKWGEISAEPTEYALTLNLNSGLLEDAPSKYVVADGLKLPTPTREGYEFLGWFDNAELTGEAVAEIAAGSKGDKELWAKWAEIVVEGGEFNIEYDLNGGEWPSEKVDSYEEFREAILSDFEAYFSSIAGKEVKINRVSENTDANKDNWHITDLMGVSYLYRDNIEAFFTTHEVYAAKWGWVYDQLKADGIEADTAWSGYKTTVLRAWTHGFIYQTQYSKWPAGHDYSAMTFEQIADKCNITTEYPGAAKYDSSLGLTLATVSKEGYKFLGWELDGEVITEIKAGTTGDLKLTAKFIQEGAELVVGADKEYKTLADALAAAKEGDTIVVEAGEYEGAEIKVNYLTILGPNAGVNPNKEQRQAEAVFGSDIVISANGVTIDGIQTTADSRLKGGAAGFDTVVIKNVWSKGSTLNPAAENSNNAPFYFSSSTAGVEYKNVQLLQVRMSDRQDGRPMAAYFDQVNGLTIKDSQFIGKRSNYNDAIKMGNEDSSEYGVKGEVEIIGNHFENFAQYVLWFQKYAEGNYVISNNTFLNNGQTAGSHNAARFAKYVGAESGVSAIEFTYNTVNNSYMLIRLDATTARNASTQPVKVNYNKLLNSACSYAVKNANNYAIDATNNYYSKAPTAGLFMNANWEPYYAKESDVPAYGQDLSFGQIEWDAQEGTIEGTAPEQFDVNAGLDKLPTASKEGYEFLGWALDGEIITAIAPGTSGKVTLVAQFKEIGLYVGQGGDYATIAEALAAAKAGDKIILLAGEYTENVTISLADLTIKGPNAGISAVDGERVAEALIKGIISIDASATGLTIDGLAFTGAAQVKASATSATYSDFAFLNNKVYDTNASATAWVGTSRYAMDGFVDFKLASGGKCLNFVFFNNSFENVDAVNLLINRARNLSVDGNLFKDFGQDAIRIEGGYATGVIALTNNEFVQTTAGHGYNGLFLYSGSGPDGHTKVVVENNLFKQLGQANSAPFHGAISANVYQEYPLDWHIQNNVFDHCYDYMWLRNNGADASIWSCKVENNQFLGLPNSFYFGTYNGSDTESTNPHLAVFGANYYEDNDGNVVSDLSQYADMFKHLSTYGTALAAKPEAKDAEKYEFWSISYELGGGSAKGLVTEYNKDSGAIALPTPTWNIYHEFKQWTLNGQVITEIPADAKGDLVIVAEWTEIEGNPVTLNFELDGGNWRYSSFEDISADLLADYNAYGGTNYTADTLPTGAWVNINIHNFYYSEGMSEKWAWLAGWLGEVGGSANKPGCKALLDYTDAASFAAKNGNYPYEVSYEFRAIMKGSYIHSNASYKTPDYTEAALRAQIWEPLAKAQKNTLETTEGKILTLPEAHKQYLKFVGWYTTPDFSGDPVTEITVGATNPTYYAKYVDPNPVTEIKVSDFQATMKRFETQQLVWEVIPAAAANKEVNFASSDVNVATVDAKGFVTAVAKGNCTITISSSSYPDVKTVLELTVEEPTYLDAGYVTTSYVKVEETIELYANVVNGEGTVEWSSKDESIAKVENGVVTGVKAGTTTIVAKLSEELSVELFVTVLEGEASEILAFLLDNHNANIFRSYDLGIGSGTPAYYADIYSSVSKVLMNHELTIDKTYLDKGNASGDYYENANLQTQYGGLQFVTFHYTAGMGATADTDNHASYFTGGSADVSIHYVTGNKGSDSNGATSEVYQTLDHAHGAWHAGDSNSRYYSNSTNLDESGLRRFEWIPTGVAYDGSELLDIEWTASDDFYFEINGKKTTIKLPETYNYKERNTNHIYNADGTISSQDSFTFSWAKFQNRTPESFFNDQGFAVKVIEGQYYMGPTWWSYGQVVEGRICAVGGNQNSIGIESCVNEGSDLWLTWQISAQLIAKLLNDNGLTIDRVKGHHFFDGKDCPQPLLENDLAIWYEFIELIKAELEVITTFKDYEIEFVSNNTELVDANGRVVKAPEFATSVSYTVTVKKDGQVVETITLGSLIPGVYEKK